jgi:predicted  nucleic acid-binding Zn-ribbon protein
VKGKTMPDKKEMTVKEAGEVLARSLRDDLNQDIGRQQLMEYKRQLIAACEVAQNVNTDKAEVGLEDDVARLTTEKASLTKSVATLQGQTKNLKDAYLVAQQKLDDVSRELATKQGELEAATAVIQRGQEVQRTLAALGDH